MVPTFIVRMLSWWRSEWITQTEARERLQKAAAGLPKPRPCPPPKPKTIQEWRNQYDRRTA